MSEHILVLDTETTGVDSENHALIEACAILYKNKKEVSRYSFRQPVSGQKVDLAALKYNGYNIEYLTELNNNAAKMSTHIGGFLDYLLELPKDTVLAGHNVDFDINFLKKDIEKLGLENLNGIIPRKKYDTKTIAEFLKKTQQIKFEKTNLHELAKKLEIEYEGENLHSSSYDAELTAKVLFKMFNLLSK